MRQNRLRRWILLLTSVFLLVTDFRGNPHPAASGAGLGVALAMAVSAAGLAGLIGTGVLVEPYACGLGAGRRGLVVVGSLGLLLVSSGTLVWLQPQRNGCWGWCS